MDLARHFQKKQPHPTIRRVISRQVVGSKRLTWHENNPNGWLCLIIAMPQTGLAFDVKRRFGVPSLFATSRRTAMVEQVRRGLEHQWRRTCGPGVAGFKQAAHSDEECGLGLGEPRAADALHYLAGGVY